MFHRAHLLISCPFDMGIHIRQSHPEHLSIVACLWLAYAVAAMALGRTWIYRSATRDCILDLTNCHARPHSGTRRRRDPRACALLKPETRCRHADSFFVRNVDVSGTHFFELCRDSGSSMVHGAGRANHS